MVFLNSQKAEKQEKPTSTMMLKISLAMIFISAMLESNRANATVFSGSVMASIAVHVEGINEILQMLVSITTIGVGITTIIVARYNFKKMKKKDDQGPDG